MTRRDLSLVPKAGAPLCERDDDQLMQLASAGLRDAFQVLVERHHGKLTNFCVKASLDRRSGEELAQECWLRVWSHRADYRGDGRFLVFLYTIARNRCRNARRDHLRRERWLSFVESPPEPAGAATPDHLDALIASERQRRLLAALDELPEKFRDVLLLRYAQELGYPEIAAIVESPEGTVRSRVHHALSKLRGALWRREEP